MNPNFVIASVVLLAAVICLAAEIRAQPVKSLEEKRQAHHLSKRSFHNIGCVGEFQSPAFARLNRVCEDCYNMYKDPMLHMNCRSQCFSNDIFEKCVDGLLIDREKENIQEMVDKALGRL